MVRVSEYNMNNRWTVDEQLMNIRQTDSRGGERGVKGGVCVCGGGGVSHLEDARDLCVGKTVHQTTVIRITQPRLLHQVLRKVATTDSKVFA